MSPFRIEVEPLGAFRLNRLMALVDFTPEHLGLPARDPVPLRHWYERVLGARLVFENGQVPPAFLLAMPGGLLIEIYAADFSILETRDNKLAGWRHLALRVESIELARETLTGRGVIFEEEIKAAGGGGRVLFFKDPEGNLLHLVERPTHWLRP